MIAPGSGGAPLVCPRCQTPDCSTPIFTWWGGFLGTQISSHVKCSRCRFSFDPTTGQPIIGRSATYAVIVGVVALVLILAFIHAAHL
jgi:hypothetical protein